MAGEILSERIPSVITVPSSPTKYAAEFSFGMLSVGKPSMSYIYTHTHTHTYIYI
jgi:hypothetical protein